MKHYVLHWERANELDNVGPFTVPALNGPSIRHIRDPLAPGNARQHRLDECLEVGGSLVLGPARFILVQLENEEGSRIGRRSIGQKELHAGRRPQVELRPEAVAIAKRLHRASPKTGERMSLRDIAHELARAGYVTADGWRFNPGTVKAMIDGPSKAEV